MNSNADKPSYTPRLPAGPCSLAFFGLAFARAWVSVVFVGISQSVPFQAFSHDMFDAFYTLAAVLAFVFAKKVFPLSYRGAAKILIPMGLVLASVAYLVAPLCPDWLLGPVRISAAALGGVAFLAFTFLNFELMSCVSLMRALLYLTGSGLLGSALVFFLTQTGTAQTAVAALALPIIAVALQNLAFASLSSAERLPKEGIDCTPPWRLFVVVAAFSLVYGL